MMRTRSRGVPAIAVPATKTPGTVVSIVSGSYRGWRSAPCMSMPSISNSLLSCRYPVINKTKSASTSGMSYEETEELERVAGAPDENGHGGRHEGNGHAKAFGLKRGA